MTGETPKTAGEWVEQGYELGFCGQIFCWMHDMPPMTDAEKQEADGGDPCIAVIRIYHDKEERDKTESDYTP